MASSSLVAAFSRARSSSSWRCQVASSTTGGSGVAVTSESLLPEGSVGRRGSGAEGLDLHLSVDKTAGFVGASAGQQGDEDLGVGGTPAGDRVPAGSGLVAGDRDRWRGGGEDHSVVAGGDVVERLVVQRAAGDRGCDGWHRVQPRWQPIIGGRADQPAET